MQQSTQIEFFSAIKSIVFSKKTLFRGKVRKPFFVLLTLFFAVKPSMAIFGGSGIDLAMRDSMVSLLMENGTCSGTLLAPNVVLSAAHCRDMFGAPIKATLLSRDPIQKHCNTSAIVDFAYSPSAKPTFPRGVHAPDLAMFRLATNLCGASPATLGSHALQAGDILYASGFGGGDGLWFEAHQISLTMIPPELAPSLSTAESLVFTELLDLSVGFYQYAIPTMENTTVCGGDSGGPVFRNRGGRMELYGVNGAVFPNKNLGADRCNNGYLHLLTPVEPHLQWIQLQVERWPNDGSAVTSN